MMLAAFLLPMCEEFSNFVWFFIVLKIKNFKEDKAGVL